MRLCSHASMLRGAQWVLTSGLRRASAVLHSMVDRFLGWIMPCSKSAADHAWPSCIVVAFDNGESFHHVVLSGSWLLSITLLIARPRYPVQTTAKAWQQVGPPCLGRRHHRSSASAAAASAASVKRPLCCCWHQQPFNPRPSSPRKRRGTRGTCAPPGWGRPLIDMRHSASPASTVSGR